MAKVRSSWRLLRPLLIAGAVTATWLTLSSSAASADSSKEPGSVLGGVTSSVSSLSAPLKAAVTPVVGADSPAAPVAAPTGLLQPMVGSLATTADQLVAAVPVVKSVVPSGTVSAVTVPVASAADGAVSGLLDAAVPPLVDAVPVLEPVVQPVAGLVTGATPIAAVLPGVVEPSVELPEALALDTATLQTAPEAPAPTVADDSAAAIDVAAVTPRVTLAVAQISDAATPGAFVQQAAAGSPVTEEPSPSPVPAPAVPGSGTGSAASPYGSSGAAAWLNDFHFDLPLTGTFPISGTFGHAPAPVSFDPGSSPD